MPNARRKLPPPRWQTPLPPGVAGSYGPAVIATARDVLGLRLDRWQERGLNRALAYLEDGRLAHHLFVLSAARQQGKTALVRALIAYALTAPDGPPWSHVLGLAHDRAQARLPYEEVMRDLAPLSRRYGRAALAVTRYLGIRSDLHGRHREYHVGSRDARDAIRGMSVDLGIFDEVRTQRDWQTYAALEPTTTARPDPLILAISTAGDDRSVVLRDWWERGRRIMDGAEEGHGFGMTWYAASETRGPDDPREWLEANPAVAEGRIPVARLEAAYHGTPAALFRAERLNLWTDAADEWLPPGAWRRGNVDEQPDRSGVRVTFGLEAEPGWRRASIVAAIATGSGTYVGLVASVAPTPPVATVAPADLTAELDRVVEAWRPASVAWSAASAAGPHLLAWAERHELSGVGLAPRQLRQASETFRAEIVGGRVTHPDDPLLAYQVRAARPSGPIESGDWYLSVRESAGEVDAIRAAAWALFANLYPPESELAPQVFLR